jgi:uncharacterized protein (TIGR03083 family)
MPDLAGAYHDARVAMTDLVHNASADALSSTVPACPDWRIQDLIAHVTSIATELSEGRFPPDLNTADFWNEEMARIRDQFVDSQLEARRDRTLDQLLAEWEEGAAKLEAILRGERPMPPNAPPLADWVVVTDIGMHLQDLRGALGLPGDPEVLATGLALRSYVEGMRFRSMQTGDPAFRIRAGSREWVIGSGDPVATLTGDPLELARAASGRRSPDQIRAYDWDGDPEPFIDFFYPYGLRTDALVE